MNLVARVASGGVPTCEMELSLMNDQVFVGSNDLALYGVD